MRPPPKRSQVAQPSALSRLWRIRSAVARASCPALTASQISFSWLSRPEIRCSRRKISPAAGLPLYCWYFFRRGLGSNPVYPALLYLAQSFASILGMMLLVRSLLFPDAPAEELSGFLLSLIIALGLLVPLMTGISAGICRLARRRMGR